MYPSNNDVRMSVSITFNSSVETSGQWIEFIDDVMQLFKLFDLEITNFGIESENYHSPKVRCFKRRAKFIEAIKAGEAVKWMEFDYLPTNYRQAAFDYELMIYRGGNCITLIVDKCRYQKDCEEQTLEILSKYIDAESVEIYEMDKREAPYTYAIKMKPVSPYKTFRLLDSSEIEGSKLLRYVTKGPS